MVLAKVSGTAREVSSAESVSEFDQVVGDKCAFSHVVFELPVDRYTTWASGESGDPAHLGQPNLLGVESPLLGVLSAGISLALSAGLLATIVSLLADAFRARRDPARPATGADRPGTH